MRPFAVFLLMSALVAGQSHHDAEDMLREGQGLVEAGKLAEAQELYEKGIRRFPGNPHLCFELGMVYFREHEWAKAIENYRSSLRVRPKQVKALFYLAESYAAASDRNQALETMGLAAAIAPNDPQVCHKYGEYLVATLDTRKEGISWLQKARTSDPNLDGIDLEIGKAQFDLTDFQSASGNFDLALKKDPGSGEAGFFLAESWAHLGEWERARDCYNFALSHGYANGAAYYGLGTSLVQLGEFSSAVEPLERSEKMQPSLIRVHFQLAKAYRQLGRGQESRRQAELFAAMNDRVNTSRELNGTNETKAWKHVKPLLDAGNEQEALKYLVALPGSDSFADAYPIYLLGVMYNSMGRQDDAKRVLATGKAKAPQDAHLAAYLGMVQLSSGEVTSAAHTLRAALALDPAEELALVGMGSLEYQQQRWTHAIEYLEKSRTADPGVLYMLCDAYFRVGKIAQAMLTAEVIRALGSEQKTLIDAVDKLVALHRSNQPAFAQ
jgi:tetratricopeptide (TPR) repeat protein